jgi:hypothetical protein
MRRANFNPFTRMSPLAPGGRDVMMPPTPLSLDPADPMSPGELIACARMVARGEAVDTTEARRLRLDEGKAKPGAK